MGVSAKCQCSSVAEQRFRKPCSHIVACQETDAHPERQKLRRSVLLVAERAGRAAAQGRMTLQAALKVARAAARTAHGAHR